MKENKDKSSSDFEKYVLMCMKSDYRNEYEPQIGDKIVYARELPGRFFCFPFSIDQIETIKKINMQTCRLMLCNDKFSIETDISFKVIRDPDSCIIPLFAGIGLYKNLIANLQNLMLKKYNKIWNNKEREWRRSV